MPALNLRTRLLTGVGLIAILQVGIAFVVVAATREQLIDQVDDRLTVAASSGRDAGFSFDSGFDRERDHRYESLDEDRDEDRDEDEDGHGDGDRHRPERLSDTYEGSLQSDGTLVDFFAPNSTGSYLPPPEIDIETAYKADGRPITVDATRGELDYRAVASESDDGGFLITAIPLYEVDDTVARLGSVVAITVGAITVALALIAWWVLRLGIAPIKRMTATAEAIGAGDLSERVTDTDPRTEAGQLGHALNTMLGRIESSLDERARAESKLRQFIADASHERRTPVATIRGYAELYHAGGLDDQAELDDAMRRTEQESQRMSRLIADMLNLAKLDRDPDLLTRPVDLAALARDAVADAQATHPNRTVNAETTGPPLVVDGDEDLLRQVLANLIGNAIVHTDPSATVTVTASRDKSAAVLEVVDKGQGMTPDVVARVTERFYRADPSRSRHKGGSGLGLAIADSVIAAHHGTLTVASAPGEGTTVAITIPSAAAA